MWQSALMTPPWATATVVPSSSRIRSRALAKPLVEDVPALLAGEEEALTGRAMLQHLREPLAEFRPGEAGAFADVVFGEVWFKLEVEAQRIGNHRRGR